MIGISSKNIEFIDRRALDVVVYCGALSRYSEKGLHLEENDRSQIDTPEIIAGLINIGSEIYEKMTSEGEVFSGYIQDIRQLELRSLHHISESDLFFNVNPDSVRSWANLQAMQQMHDMHYHPEVVMRGSQEHLKHIVAHLGSTNLKLIEAFRSDDRKKYGRAALLVVQYGVKGATALGVELPDHKKPRLSTDDVVRKENDLL